MDSGNSFINNGDQNTSNIAAYPSKLLKTVSSPTALNTSNTNSGGSITLGAKSSSPTLAQLAQQPLSSFNFRHSLLYDSGAESGDADDHQRLIRTPSVRSHKFIIIPASGTMKGSGEKDARTRQTLSTNSLATMATSTPNTQQQEEQQYGISPKRESKAMESTPTAVAPAFLRSTSSQSDVIHQRLSARSAAAAAATPTASTSTAASVATGVKFTLFDYETSGAGALSIADPVAVTSIGSPSTTSMSNLSARKAGATATTTATTTPAQQSGFGPRNDRVNSSMRSEVSVHAPTTMYDDNNASLQHNASVSQKLSPGSFLPRDHSTINQIYSDVTSVRSIASIGIGSTDGHKLVIRRVPHTPNELFNMVHPPSPPPPGFDDDDDDSFMDISNVSANLKPRKQHWANKMQFVLACIGYSVGLGNVWRFPYMCYKSGGGVFLVPYCIIMLVCSIPLLFMELSIGQYTGRGPIGALGQLCPLFKGAGLASVVVSFLMSTYYSVIIGYSIYYFFTAFKADMPWIDCSNRWNTPNCWVPQRKNRNITAPSTSRTPSEEFFENKMLQISPGIEYPGLMRWELFACLICAWLMVYFATWKSIKSSAKVRYFTATFPFVLILILMGRAVTLEGADDGLRFFFRPNWSELKNANVWINAASQNFNSLGITFGSMISFASYNKYNNNIARDTISVSVVNIITSLLVGVFAFATLGNLALEQNTNVRDVIGDGPGLIFVVYPQAMAKMPYAQLWAVMFFFMLLCLGLNSQFAIVEVVVTSIQDGYPNWIKRHLGYHEIVVLFVCVISFLFGLPNLIQGGIYFFQIMDHYAASITIVFLAFCQLIAIAWFYGTERLSKNIKQMTGKAPSFYLKSCWVLFGPCLLFAIWILSLINYHEPTYHNGRYKYPEWAYGIGWMFASFSLICIPGYAIINVLRSSGGTFWERIQNTLRPNIYECKICGEHHCEHDYPEQEQYMLAQEMANVYKPTMIESHHPLNLGLPTTEGNKMGYNPMYLQTQLSPPLNQERKRQHQEQLKEEADEHQPHNENNPEKIPSEHENQDAAVSRS